MVILKRFLFFGVVNMYFVMNEIIFNVININVKGVMYVFNIFIMNGVFLLYEIVFLL